MWHGKGPSTVAHGHYYSLVQQILIMRRAMSVRARNTVRRELAPQRLILGHHHRIDTAFRRGLQNFLQPDRHSRLRRAETRVYLLQHRIKFHSQKRPHALHRLLDQFAVRNGKWIEGDWVKHMPKID